MTEARQPDAAVHQERLWITEPSRATCLATVTAVSGDFFAVDRAIFAPRSTECRHPQYADTGTIWWNGEKRRLAGVKDQGKVWYRLRGTTPTVGAQLQCQLNQDIRQQNDRAHTAMHLAIAALQKQGAPAMSRDPEVKGGGNFRITLAYPPEAEVLNDARKQVQHWLNEDLLVTRTFEEKSHLPRLADGQTFSPPDDFPGGPVVSVVAIGEVCSYPCDGTHVDRTSRINAITWAHAAQGAGGFVLVGRVT